jgi:glycosyltransferase involved in cell wall biosynthesis
MKPQHLTALPVFNEQDHIVSVLDEVKRYCSEILVIDDGSSDGTAEILTQQDGIRVVTHATNQGYGAALRTAFRYSIEHEFDVLVTIDCDGQHEPQLIPELAAAIFPDVGEPFDIVSGSRYLKQFAGESSAPKDRRRINMDITRVINQQLGLTLTDSFCGFKAYRTPALENLSITELGYAMPLQLWVQATKLGLRIMEFPVPLVYLEEERSFGGSLDDARLRMAYYQQVLEREMASASLERS